MNIVFLLTHVPNPRMLKRMEAMKKFGDIEVVCARRASQNIWEVPEGYKVNVFDIDLPSSKQLIKRVFASKQFSRNALGVIRDIAPDLIYAEGLDSLQIASQYKKKHKYVRIFFEVADLRECFIEEPKSLLGKLQKSVIAYEEKLLFSNVERLIVTSEKFYDKHYCGLIGRERVVFQPNIPDVTPFASYQKKNDGTFTVGFIGGIRYLEQMKMLVDASEAAECNVLFAGAAVPASTYEKIQEYCKGKGNIEFTGRYDYNSQIADLYSRVDCVYAVYDADNPNVRIALPNKLYESVYCDLPILVAKGTYLSEIVEEMGVGISVHHKNVNELVVALEKLKNDCEYYDEIVENCKKGKDKLLCSAKYQKALEKAVLQV